MAFEREDISLEAKWPYLVFGDLYIAQIVSMVPGVDESGNSIWKLTLIPSEELAKRHSITLDMLDQNLTLKVDYPYDMIQQLSADPGFPGYFCFLNFKGEECPGTKFWKGFLDAKRMAGYERKINLLQSEIAWKTEQLEIAKTNITQYIKEFIMNPSKELSADIIAQFQASQQAVGPVRQGV